MVALTWPQKPTESSRPASPCSKSRDPSWAVPGTRQSLLGSQSCSGNPCSPPTPGSVPDPRGKAWSEPQCDLGQMPASVDAYHLHCAHHGVLQV